MPPKSNAGTESAKVAIFWDPEGFELDTLGSQQLLKLTDGDTPTVSMNVRMLSVDTPEMHYPGTTNRSPGKFTRRSGTSR